MADAAVTLAVLKDAVRRFVAEREWEQFHSPKNLAMALSVEAAELLEHFLWIEGEASRQVVSDPAELGEVGDELADVMVCVLCLANALGIDISDAVEKKMAKNAAKYPVEKTRGRWRASE